MEAKDYIARLNEINSEKLALLDELFLFSKSQRDAILSGRLDELETLITEKQHRMDAIDRLDEKFVVYAERLKKMLSISSFQSLADYGFPGTRELKELGEKITNDYKDSDNFIVIGVLKGAVVFMSDLIRSIELPLKIDFMAVSSYGTSTESSGVVRILKDLDESVEGKDVLIVEDIVDSGLTLSYMHKILKSRKPASLKICTLLDKPNRRKVDLKIDYLGFEIPDDFVVGYGLDYAGKYRNLRDICVLKPEIYKG